MGRLQPRRGKLGVRLPHGQDYSDLERAFATRRGASALVSRGIGARSSKVLPRDFGPIAASAESETGRRVVAWKEGRFALFNHAEGWPEANLRMARPDVTSLTLEHDWIVAVTSSGLRATWPFFRDVSALVRFARDHLPF